MPLQHVAQDSINQSERRTERPLLGAILLFCFSLTFIFSLHPLLGVRDVDGYAYIMGARSLHREAGYRSLTGEPFNHWPPGYSLLLSPFADPVRAALILNYLSFGAVIGLLYYLLRRLGWTWQAGLGFSVTLASGFFRLLANQAHPDVLTYALFLAAILLALWRPARTLPALVWAFLVPIKLIAVIFFPPALVADKILRMRQDWKSLLRSYMPAGIATAISIGGILVFNVLTVGAGIPTSLKKSSLKVFASAPKSSSFPSLAISYSTRMDRWLFHFFGLPSLCACFLPRFASALCGQHQLVSGLGFMVHYTWCARCCCFVFDLLIHRPASLGTV